MRRHNVRAPQAIETARVRAAYQNGKHVKQYVVTVRRDHHVTVFGDSDEQASERGLTVIAGRYPGSRPEVVEVEDVS